MAQNAWSEWDDKSRDVGKKKKKKSDVIRCA